MNHVKEGYKQTKVGVIPDAWTKFKLSDIKKCVELEHLSQETGKLLGSNPSKGYINLNSVFFF